MAESFSIVEATPPPAQEPPAFRVLTIVSRPLDVNALPEIGDAWSLADALAKVEAPVALRFCRPPTAETLRRRLAEGWDVVHFDGHGVWAWTCPACGAFIPKDEEKPDPMTCDCSAPRTDPAEGFLAFERDDGLLDLLPASEFAQLLCPPTSPPSARLVILTACQSAMGSPSLADVLLQAGVPVVLAMRASVTVGAVVALLPPFYANLAAGKTLRQAFAAALPALERLNRELPSATPHERIPVLLPDGTDFALCPAGKRGHAQVEHEPLVGVPRPSESGHFYGQFIPGESRDQPPGGRKGYLVRLAHALERGERLVMLTGIGGIGKSAIAAAAARRLAWRYPGGVFWVNGREYLETGLRPDDVLGVFHHVFGGDYDKLPTPRRKELAFAYLRRIEAPALLVVDNADVADAASWDLLRAVPQPGTVLATTRIAPEYGGSVIHVDKFAPEEGVLFLANEIARRKNDLEWRRRLEHDEAGLKTLFEIARLLDGHALALLHAAAMAADMGLGLALKQVQANPARGETGSRFDFSYNPLEGSQKELLHRLAAFAADFSQRAIEALCSPPFSPGGEKGGAGGGLRDWNADLPELVRRSLVDRRERPSAADRFWLHPVWREYVRGKAGPEAMTAHDQQMARYFLALADWGYDQLGNTETALQAVWMAMTEQANLGAAQETCLAQEMWAEAISLAYDLDNLFERSGDWAARRRTLEAGIQAAQRGQQQHDEAGLAHNLGMLAQEQGDYAAARDLYTQSLEIARRLGDQAGIAYTLGQLGNLAYLQGNLDEARELYEQVRHVSEQLGDQQSVAKALHQLGILAQRQGDYPAARDLYTESLEIERRLGNQAGIATTLHQLGMLAQRQGDYPAARDLYTQSLEIKRQLGNQARIATTLHQLGNVAYLQGDYPAARDLYTQSLDIARRLGDHAGIAQTLHQMGVLAEEDGNLKEAERLFVESLATLEALHSPDAAIARQSLERVRQRLEGAATDAQRISG